MAENKIETNLDPEKVATEILGKVFNIKLKDCKIWKCGIAKITNNHIFPDICFAILQASHIPCADQGNIVASAFERKFFSMASEELPVLALSKEDRDFIWISLFGSGAPIGVFTNGDKRWVRNKRFEGFCCESLEQALIEFSLKEGIALGNG